MPENHFTLFSLPEQFSVDAAALERAYFALQRQHHPDRFATAGATERAAATRQSVLVNDAYHTLKSPLLRAQYMLRLRGIGDVKPDQETLMENMEMQEQLAEAKDEAAIAALAARAAGMEQQCLAALERAFAAAGFPHAAQEALRLSYFTKLNEGIRLKRFTLTAQRTQI